MINLSSGFLPDTVEPVNVGRLRSLLALTDEYATLTDEGRAEYVRLRVSAIVSEFVLPVIALVIRNRYEMVQALEAPGAWSDVEALNWGRMPQPQFALGGFGPINRALATRIKEVGGLAYEAVQLGDTVVFVPM